MNYGLYLSAAGALNSLHRQDVWANNLANVNTVGFKADDVDLRTRLPERLESQAAAIDPQWLLEQLGGGTFAEATRTNLRQADLTQTRNDLDLAIQGEGFFVVSKTSNGDASQIRLTRDGRFARNTNGELIMAATGLRVLDENNQPIHIAAAGKIHIDAQGQITQNNQAVGTLQIVSVNDAASLVKEGSNLLRAAGPTKPASGMIRQGALESSGVDPILAMNQMINASKAVQANVTMMQYHDNIIGQAVNTFGRVA